ncbi:hypothetical protein EDD29_1284 [Actinocorallia herbida]|uniref:Uncharacterized protein n=1 Tax=Actinocorallia herbida TaxID=58109 RepID=A0A3N1CRE6_9ACTN|nr:hypothetical protein EDD29_1284 [Actinocorallia herbida]
MNTHLLPGCGQCDCSDEAQSVGVTLLSVTLVD